VARIPHHGKSIQYFIVKGKYAMPEQSIIPGFIDRQAENDINEVKANTKGISNKRSDLNSTLIRLDGRLQPIESKINDKREMLKAWLPAIFAGICTIIAALIACFH
jgi:hypothetical protein